MMFFIKLIFLEIYSFGVVEIYLNGSVDFTIFAIPVVETVIEIVYETSAHAAFFAPDIMGAIRTSRTVNFIPGSFGGGVLKKRKTLPVAVALAPEGNFIQSSIIHHIHPGKYPSYPKSAPPHRKFDRRFELRSSPPLEFTNSPKR